MITRTDLEFPTYNVPKATWEELKKGTKSLALPRDLVSNLMSRAVFHNEGRNLIRDILMQRDDPNNSDRVFVFFSGA